MKDNYQSDLTLYYLNVLRQAYNGSLIAFLFLF